MRKSETSKREISWITTWCRSFDNKRKEKVYFVRPANVPNNGCEGHI